MVTALRLKVDRDPVSLLVLDNLAATYRLSVYGAAYLELALRRALPLATCDAALLKALPVAGVEPAPP
jgi:predicted nucleic acid-binding protein